MIKVGHTLPDSDISEQYERLGGSLEMPSYFYPALADYIGNVGNASILDAGCGTGDLLKEVQTRNPSAKLLGIELAQSRVEVALKRLGTNADVRCGSITANLPFDEDCADLILVTEVLEHLKDPISCLKNLKPLLKPGGQLIVTFPNSSAWLPWSILAERLTPHFKPFRGFLPHEHPYRTIQPIDTVFSQREVFGMLSQSGLRMVDKACYEVFPYIAEFAFKFTPKMDIAPIRKPLDRLASRFGWTALGYRVFTRSVVI
jgi:2-polyprenyl-3-methyl-5-hydroxy-6-metoxy-1,4-benzoquinol methylase